MNIFISLESIIGKYEDLIMKENFVQLDLDYLQDIIEELDRG